MFVNIRYSGFWFCVCLAVVIATSVIMNHQSRQFYLLDGTRKPFSIFNLEFPDSKTAIQELILKVRALPAQDSKTVIKALRGQLFVDFLFMPATYLGIMIACMGASKQLSAGWASVFIWLGCLQFIAWALDITENLILLRQVNDPTPFSGFTFYAYWTLEFFKWIPSLGGFLSSGCVLIFHLLNKR